MNLIRYEIKAGFFKGFLFGVRHYPFDDEEIYEEDIVLYIGIFQIIITLIYEKWEAHKYTTTMAKVMT